MDREEELEDFIDDLDEEYDELDSDDIYEESYSDDYDSYDEGYTDNSYDDYSYDEGSYDDSYDNYSYDDGSYDNYLDNSTSSSSNSRSNSKNSDSSSKTEDSPNSDGSTNEDNSNIIPEKKSSGNNKTSDSPNENLGNKTTGNNKAPSGNGTPDASGAPKSGGSKPSVPDAKAAGNVAKDVGEAGGSGGGKVGAALKVASELAPKKKPKNNSDQGEVPEELGKKKSNVPKGKDDKEKDPGNEENVGKDIANKAKDMAKERGKDTVKALKGIAEIYAGDKVQGIIDVAPLVLKQLKFKIMMYLIGFATGLFLIIAIFYAIIGPIDEAVKQLKEFWNGTLETGEKVNNLYSGLGFRTTDEAFYRELDYIYSNNFEDVNLTLIMSALFYTETTNENSTDYNDTTGLEDVTPSFNSQDGITQGKILRARKLADGMTEETDGEKVTLTEFIRLYADQVIKNEEHGIDSKLGLIMKATNPMSYSWDLFKTAYNIVAGPTFATTDGELFNDLKNSFETATLGIKTISSISFEWAEGEVLPNIYVTMRIKAYNEDKFKQFLATKYIPKMPEFKPYIENLTGTARDNEIKRIITEIYEHESWYTAIYGLVEGNVENNDGLCKGNIDVDVLSELELPVNASSFNFDEETGYGVTNSGFHSALDITEANSGVKVGDDVIAIAPGKILEINTDIDCKSDDECEENGSYIAIQHSIASNGNTYTFISYYANLKKGSSSLKVGDKVKKGDKIAKVGDTGHLTNGGLHFAFLKGQTLKGSSALDPTNLFVSCNSGGLVGDDNIEKIWFYFRNLGYSETSTAAALGNISVESAGTFDGRIVQGHNSIDDYCIDYTNKVDSGAINRNDFAHNGPNGGGYGLIQFTFYTLKQELYDHAKEVGQSVGDLQTQLEVVYAELEGSGWNGNNSLRNTWRSGDLMSATEAFMRGFERPGTPHLEQRKSAAQEIYNRLHGKTAPSANNVGGNVNIGGQTNASGMSHQEKLKIVFPNGIPKNDSQMQQYIVTIDVPITSKSGSKSTAKLKIHRAIAADVKAALQAAQNSGFVIYDATIGYGRMGSNGCTDTAGSVRDVGLIGSQHCYGLAVDLNVNENCFKPKNGACTVGSLWNSSNPYSITTSSAVYKSFKSNGWGWGGEWNSSKDYMHFSFFGT